MRYHAGMTSPGDPSTFEPVRYPQWQRAQGSRWWKPWLALLIFGLIYGGSLLLLRAGVNALGPGVRADEMPWFLLLLNLSLIGLIPASMLAVRLGYWHPAGSLLSLWQRMRWGWLLRAWAVSWLAMGPLLLLDLFLVAPHPIDLRGQMLWPVVMLLFLTPLQCAGEELAFRGLAAQVVGSFFRQRVVSIALSLLIPSLLFAMMHGPQDGPLFLARFGLGLLFGWLTLRTGGLEAAIALHTLNNQTAFLDAVFTNRLQEALFMTKVDWITAVVQLLLVGLAAWIIWRAYQNREAARWTLPHWPAQKPVATAEANESRAAQG